MGEELFETFNEQGEPQGLVPRSQVHHEGLWHKSASVLLFDESDRLLLQRRSMDKDLYAGLWDYSVGEHLKPGENFLAGALRGLSEELGVNDLTADQLSELADPRWMQFETPQSRDYEIQQAFRCTYSGVLRPNAEEVAEIAFYELPVIRDWVHREPSAFTPWFVEHLRLFGWL